LLRVQARSARRLVIATKAAMGAADPAKGPPPMTDHDDIEPAHATSATDLVLNELQLFGYHPFDDQPDPRPLRKVRRPLALLPTSSTPWSPP
jgi:aryl-alcohol dehydrogenase-like predicted oxidoreductase